jgi:hypothetical protein
MIFLSADLPHEMFILSMSKDQLALRCVLRTLFHQHARQPADGVAARAVERPF